MLNKPFKAALLMSIGLHIIVLSPIPGFVSHHTEKSDTKMEVTYIETEEIEAIKEELPDEALAEVTLKKDIPAPSKTNDTIKEEAETQEKAPEEAKDQNEASEKEIKKIFSANEALDLNALSSLKGTSDSLNYLKEIRDKISRYVHRKYGAYMGDGEAILHFVLSLNGSVKSARVIGGSINGNSALHDLCLDSIYKSSPFRRFPNELDLEQAAFKIHISFKRN
ncbi:MAG: hypothetical protein ABH875_02485 [Candidatus Omnitrophota bacterium]